MEGWMKIKSRWGRSAVRARYVRSATTGQRAGLLRKSGMVTGGGDRPAVWFLYKNWGMTPRVRDDPALTKARREKCASSAQRLPAARAVRNNVFKNARRRGQIAPSTLV